MTASCIADQHRIVLQIADAAPDVELRRIQEDHPSAQRIAFFLYVGKPDVSRQMRCNVPGRVIRIIGPAKLRNDAGAVDHLRSKGKRLAGPVVG